MEETHEIMRFLVGQVSSDTYVNIMDQYYPAGKVDEKKYDEINRRINSLELREAYEVASAEGLWRFNERRQRAMVY